MAKGYKKHQRFLPAQYRPPSSDISDDLELGRTLAPNERGTTINNYWMSNSTSAPSSDDDGEEEPGNQFAKNWSALTDKTVQGKLEVPPRTVFLVCVLLWAITVSWLFITDNQLGRLELQNGLNWIAIKAGVVTGFYFIVLIMLVLYSTFTRKRSVNPKT